MRSLESFTHEVCVHCHELEMTTYGENSSGYRVFAASRRLETMESLAKEGIETLKLDVANDDDIKEAVNEIGKRTGGSLDMLVNNA